MKKIILIALLIATSVFMQACVQSTETEEKKNKKDETEWKGAHSILKCKRANIR